MPARRGAGWRAAGALGLVVAVGAGGGWAAGAGAGGGALDALEAALEAQRGALSALSASLEAQQAALASLREEQGGGGAPSRRGLSEEDSGKPAWRAPAGDSGPRRRGRGRLGPPSWDDFLRPMAVIRVPGGAGRAVVLPQADKQGLGR